MRRPTLPLALALAGLLGLLVAAPASAAVTGTVCGEVSEFTAPTAVTAGSITINGDAEIIGTEAFGEITLGTITTLNALVVSGATTCLDITADGSGDIVDLSIAAQADICGAVTLDSVTGIYSVAGVALPLTLVNADADLVALLDAALAADANVCADVSVAAGSGLIVAVGLNATLTLCGDATLDADSATVGSVDIPLSLLDAEAEAALALATDAGVDVCVGVVVDDTDLVEANVSVNVDLCGEVTLDAEGNATVDGVTIDAALLDAHAAALLALAAEADGTACASVDASSTGGNTSVGVTVSIEVCAEVTAITDGTITIGDVTFVFAGAADAGIEVGDDVCVAAATSPLGDPIITDTDTTDDDAGEGPGAGGETPLLPNTAAGQPAPFPFIGLGAALLLAAGVAWAARRREAMTR